MKKDGWVGVVAVAAGRAPATEAASWEPRWRLPCCCCHALMHDPPAPGALFPGRTPRRVRRATGDAMTAWT
jgi:hypothetical protein